MARKKKVNRMKKGFLQATGYLNEHLNEGEVPIYRAHLSWIPVFTRQIPFMLIGGIIGGITWGVTDDFLIGGGIFLLSFIIGVLGQVHRIYENIATDILLTNQGIHTKEKLIAVENNKFARYNRINDAELDYHSVLQRIFDYGDVEIVTLGTDTTDDYLFKGVAKAGIFQEAVRTAINKYQGGAMFENYGNNMVHNNQHKSERSTNRSNRSNRNDDNRRGSNGSNGKRRQRSNRRKDNALS